LARQDVRLRFMEGLSGRRVAMRWDDLYDDGPRLRRPATIVLLSGPRFQD